MDPNTQELVMGAAGASGGPKVYVEDVFSTYLYTGNGSTQTITNGIDLSGKGGLVWMKSRTVAQNNWLFDTARSTQFGLVSNLTNAEINQGTGFSSFNSNGFSLSGQTGFNGSSENIVSWTFRKAAKFFDVVTYTGNGSTQTINHNLGTTPGCIIIKCTSSVLNWNVYHRSLGNSYFLVLNNTNAATGPGATVWGNTDPTSTQFTVGSSLTTNGDTYVAYLFAHDAGGFGDSGNDNVISCGSFTTNGSGAATVSLGWEPQFGIIKSIDTGSWIIQDSIRGIPVDGSGAFLAANASSAEGVFNGPYYLLPNSTGFRTELSSNTTYIYIAIRRGPMKTPTDATKIFSALARTGTGTATSIDVGFAPDFATSASRNSGEYMPVVDKLRGPTKPLTWQQSMKSGELIGYEPDWFLSFTNTGVTVGPDNTGGVSVNSVNRPLIQYYFRRAPGFFDVVAYTGTGFANLDVSHNLGVPPEIIITKRRDTASTTGWFTSSKYYYNTDLWDRNGRLNDGTIGFSGGQVYGPDANITSTQFRIATNTSDLNASGGKYIAYLFASCPGVSKCGGYIGSGTTKQIDCGFTNGARFVLIKRADAAGDWYVWDTARGILSANDPYLLLNSTAAEVTNTDYIDPLSSGFEISSTAPAAINANGGSYIFLAIA